MDIQSIMFVSLKISNTFPLRNHNNLLGLNPLNT